MSCKILAGDDPGAQRLAWRSVMASPPVSHRAPTPVEQRDVDAREAEAAALLAQVQADGVRRAEEAFARGRQQGSVEGEHRAMQLVEPLMARLARTIDEMAATRRKLFREAEDDVIRLAVAVARRIINRELSLDPDALLGIVRTTMDKLDARDIHRVFVNPEDAARLTAEMKRLSLPRHVDVVGDSALERGAVIFETSRGIVDASASSQLEEIERGLTDMVGRRT